MLRNRLSIDISEFMHYLASHDGGDSSLPALAELSRELGISVATLREQLEVARALGLVEVRPRTGMRRLQYKFAPAIRQSLGYAIALEDSHFQDYSDLRNHIEAAYWNEAVAKLTDDDKNSLNALIEQAHEKLRHVPVQVPHEEHKNLHLLIYSRLNNDFVTGILEAYWEAYEAVGLNMYAGSIDYLNEVWGFHAKMVESICNGNFEAGLDALIAHVDLLSQRPS